VSSWELIASKNLQTLKLDKVRTKILAFAIIATLLPSVATAWLAYAQGKRALTQTISTELVGVSSQAANDVGIWLRDRFFDLKVFANSYEVSEKLGRPESRGARGHQGNDRLANYLSSVRERTTGFRELVVFDLEGRVVASSPTPATVTSLPAGWKQTVGAGEPVVGAPAWDPVSRTMTVTVAVPVQPAAGRMLGAFAAKLDMRGAQAALQTIVKGHTGTAYLATFDGERLLSSEPNPLGPVVGKLDGNAVRWLNLESRDVVEYTNPDGVAVIGTLRSVQGSPWRVLTELRQAEGFRQVNQFRNLTILVVGAICIVVGLMAYLLALILVRPLDRLTKGAGRVAQGDFEVQLPVITGGELGYLTTVFNDMVAQLRKSMQQVDAVNETLREKNAQLERLSLTDPLTGLFNRRHLMSTLEKELRRSSRGHHEFALLMMDVDHFKSYNDAFGHQAGDDALIQVANVLKHSLRDVDCPSRYGGEEFVALLPETGISQATEVAERICDAVRHAVFQGERVTISIGVAAFPTQGTTLDGLVAAADGALYRAKRQGRDRVIRADWSELGAAASQR
jgi:diguanylate cyclase (GGDEF)-like protein